MAILHVLYAIMMADVLFETILVSLGLSSGHGQVTRLLNCEILTLKV